MRHLVYWNAKPGCKNNYILNYQYGYYNIKKRYKNYNIKRKRYINYNIKKKKYIDYGIKEKKYTSFS